MNGIKYHAYDDGNSKGLTVDVKGTDEQLNIGTELHKCWEGAVAPMAPLNFSKFSFIPICFLKCLLKI